METPHEMLTAIYRGLDVLRIRLSGSPAAVPLGLIKRVIEDAYGRIVALMKPGAHGEFMELSAASRIVLQEAKSDPEFLVALEIAVSHCRNYRDLMDEIQNASKQVDAFIESLEQEDETL